MQLAAMATAAREAIGFQEVTARAARDDFKGAEFQQRAAMRITPLVPKPLTSGSKADGRLDQRDFNYGADRISCRCPAGERAIWRMTTVARGQTLPRCWPSAGPRCLFKSQCTAADSRRITRRADEAVSEVI